MGRLTLSWPGAPATTRRGAGDPEFEEAARGALAALWAMRTPLGLLGYSLDVATGRWTDSNGGIGASGDSCYEYLLKAYILFGAPAAASREAISCVCAPRARTARLCHDVDCCVGLCAGVVRKAGTARAFITRRMP